MTLDGETLMYLCDHNNLELMKQLLEANPHIPINYKKGHSVFSLACRRGYTNIVSFLIEEGVDVNDPDLGGQGFSPLFHACNNDRTDVIKILLDTPRLNVNYQLFHGYTILHDVCFYGQVELARLLLTSRSDINPNIEDSIGRTPIHVACQRGSIPELVQLLLPYIQLYHNYSKPIRGLSVVQTAYVLVCAKQVARIGSKSSLCVLPLDVIRILCSEFLLPNLVFYFRG